MLTFTGTINAFKFVLPLVVLITLVIIFKGV